MASWLKSGSSLLGTVASIGEICALCTVAWAFIFPDEAAEKWAQFQLKVESAEQQLGAINSNLEIANALAAATEASNRAIEASNGAIEASARVIAASNVIIAEQAARQTAAQEGTNINTAVLADESTRLSSLAQGLKFGAFMRPHDDGGIDLLVYIGNSSTRGVTNMQGTVLAADGTLLLVTNFGVVNRNEEAGRDGRFSTDNITDPEILSRVTVCLNGRVEGEETEFHLQAELVSDSIDSLLVGDDGIELVMPERPVITDAPTETCAA